MYLAIIADIRAMIEKHKSAVPVFQDVVAFVVGIVITIRFQGEHWIGDIGAVDAVQHFIKLKAEEVFFVIGMLN
jgi:hypothetical protein